MFSEDCDHVYSPNKDSKTRHFCEERNHDRSPNKEDSDKTQKYDISVRTAIMVTVLMNVTMIIVVVL